MPSYPKRFILDFEISSLLKNEFRPYEELHVKQRLKGLSAASLNIVSVLGISDDIWSSDSWLQYK